MVLAPESEFQLQAAYSRSASPPLWLQSGRPLRLQGHSSLCWPSPRPQPLLPVVLWEVLQDQVLGPWGWRSWAQGLASALLDKILPSLRSLQLLTPETRHHFWITSALHSRRDWGATGTLVGGPRCWTDRQASFNKPPMREMFWICTVHCGHVQPMLWRLIL